MVDIFELDVLTVVELLALLIIFIFQCLGYLHSKKMMKTYKSVFNNKKTWTVLKFEGISTPAIAGDGNEIFNKIIKSVNEYITRNAHSNIDLQALTDIVKRECEELQNKIELSIPRPQYMGLIGTMLGVCFGAGQLWINGANIHESNTTIVSLVGAVALAMVTSIIGVIMALCLTKKYEKIGNEVDGDENMFISWMQTNVFPELPSDIKSVMSNLVKNLSDFNSSFSQNTQELGSTLSAVNQSYETQKEIVETIADIHVEEIARANIEVYKSLSAGVECLERSSKRIAAFNEYLSEVRGYTEQIQKFNEQFQTAENQIDLLIEIRNFFKAEFEEISQRKVMIAEKVNDVDGYLVEAFNKLDEHVQQSFNSLRAGINVISDQNEEALRKVSEHYNEELERQGRETIAVYDKIQKQVDEKLNKLPETLEKLEEISEIPAKLDQLIESVNASLSETTKAFSDTLDRNMTSFISNLDRTITESLSNMSVDVGRHDFKIETKFPRKVTILISVCTVLGLLLLIILIGYIIFKLWLYGYII